MRLILSSCDFSNETSRQCILDNLPLPIGQCRVLFIPNEKATLEKIRGGKYHHRLEGYGFSKENIYVFDETRVYDFVGLPIDAIYVSGGNSFMTLQKLRACGFDREIVRYIQSGIFYIGGSAGAHLVTKSIEHIALYDDVPPDMTDFSGLGLFDGILICHDTPARRSHFEQLTAEGKYKVFRMTDEESIVVNAEIGNR